MKRRDFIMLTSSVLLSARVAAAQTRSGIPRVGVLDWESPGPRRYEVFRTAMRDFGYVDGENILIDYRYADERPDRAAALAAEFVNSAVNVIVAFATPAAFAAKKATSAIPIVVSSADPVGSGLVSNLVRPGGNITGVSNMMPDLESKRLELLRELMPDLKRLAFLGSANDPATRGFVRQVQEAATRTGMSVEPVLIAGSNEIDGAVARLAKDKFGAVILQPLFTLSPRAAASLAEVTGRHRMPAISSYAHFPRAGGLISYGPPADFSRRATARYVDRILKGAAAGDLAIEQPTQFELTINLKTAKALGLTVPPTVLGRADEVID